MTLKEYYELCEKVTDDDDVELLNDLAQRALKHGEYEDAKKFARRVLELNPKKERAMFILGVVLIAIDHNAEGIPYLNYLIEQDTNEHKIDAFHNLATYYVQTGNEEGLERIRNIQIGVLDDSDQYDDLTHLQPNDTLTPCKNQEVIDKVLEIASSNNNLISNQIYYFDIAKNDRVVLNIENYLPKGSLEFNKIVSYKNVT